MAADLNLLAYGAVVVLGAMAPGPDFVIVTKHATAGRRPGLAAAAGIAGGMAVNTAAALLGLGAVFLTSPTLYAAVRVVAALYLLYLGVTALWSLRPKPQPPAPPATVTPTAGANTASVATLTTAPTTSWQAFRQGLLTNFLNPKVVIFLLTLTPQFMPEDPSVLDRVGIFIVSVVAVLLWFCVLAVMVSLFSAFLQRPRVGTVLTTATGVVLVGIAIEILVTAL